MAIRRFNYTGRKKIRRQDAVVTLVSDSEPRWFDVSLTLSDYDLPSDAEVFVEAYKQTEFRRYRFGTVAMPRAIDSTDLEGLREPEELLFRVKVVDRGERVGRLLAEASALSISNPEEGNQPSFIRVRETDLGGELWRLDFTEASPVLLLEKRHGPRHLFLSSPHFRWYVLPAMLRLLLQRALDEAADEDEGESPDSWQGQALRQGSRLAGYSVPTDDGLEEDFENWITSAVKAFCRNHAFARKYAGQLFQGAEQ